MVSTSIRWLFWALWNAEMLANATSNAALTSASRSGSGRSCGQSIYFNDSAQMALELMTDNRPTPLWKKTPIHKIFMT